MLVAMCGDVEVEVDGARPANTDGSVPSFRFSVPQTPVDRTCQWACPQALVACGACGWGLNEVLLSASSTAIVIVSRL